MDVDDVSNLWLAEELHRQGGVRFGDFSLGRSTRHSPVYIDVKVLLRVPQVLRRAAELIVQETQADSGGGGDALCLSIWWREYLLADCTWRRRSPFRAIRR